MVRATRRAVRRAFTLTEMLVVVLIITVLLGIILPAIQSVKLRAQIAQAQNDISQLSTGIENFKSTYNVQFVPSHFELKSSYTLASPTDAAYIGYLKRVWPRLQNKNTTSGGSTFGTSLPDQPLNTGNACLVFFLGGLGRNGFSASEADPFTVTSGASVKGPFFEFPTKRLSTGSPIGQFLDPWNNPYVYFTSINGNDYTNEYTGNPPDANASPWNKSTNFNTINGSNALNFVPGDPAIYHDANNNPIGSPTNVFRESSTKFYNANSYQIISAGPNKQLGPGGQMVPGSGQYVKGLAGGDDICNFWPRELGTP